MKLLLTFILLSGVCFGQSKKEQIDALNNSIDSLNTVLSTTRDNASKDIDGLNTTIDGLNTTIDSLNSEIAQLKSDVSSLESSVSTLEKDKSKLTRENEKFKTDLDEMSKKNLELEAKLKAIEAETPQFKTFKVGNLEVMTEDLPEMMNWDQAKQACAALGDGWRLPTKDELNVLYKNKDNIGGFYPNYYWSITIGEENPLGIFPWVQYFNASGNQYFNYEGDPGTHNEYSVRPVRSL